MRHNVLCSSASFTFEVGLNNNSIIFVNCKYYNDVVRTEAPWRNVIVLRHDEAVALVFIRATIPR